MTHAPVLGFANVIHIDKRYDMLVGAVNRVIDGEITEAKALTMFRWALPETPALLVLHHFHEVVSASSAEDPGRLHAAVCSALETPVSRLRLVPAPDPDDVA